MTNVKRKNNKGNKNMLQYNFHTLPFFIIYTWSTGEPCTPADDTVT